MGTPQSVNDFFAASFHIISSSVEMKRLLCGGGGRGGVININSRTDRRQHSSEVVHDDVS